MSMNRLTLRDDLVAAFTPTEFAEFSKSLGFAYDRLGGRAHSDKVSSLIGKMERNARLPDLVTAFMVARPQWAARYEETSQPGNDGRDAHLLWLEDLAAGEGDAIEEPPTMKWDSSSHPPEKDSE